VNLLSRNVILDSLPAQLHEFRARLTPVQLPVGTMLYEPLETPRFAHFLTSGVASVVTVMKDGESTETGMWASEGLVQCMHVGMSTQVPSRCFMQMSGTALRMPFAELEEHVKNLPALLQGIQRSIRIQALILTQLVACNRLHEVEERLARWLLMLSDRVVSDTLPITQQFLAEMIGSRRSTVTVTAGTLQRSGLIESQRGMIRILDRERLERTACECYPIIRRLRVRGYGRSQASAEIVSSFRM
jgi:CRP-like cAMP-binding protein